MKTADEETPDDGHTFRLRVDSRMAARVVGEPHATDAAEFGGVEFVVEVRAHNLRDALHKAAALDLGRWHVEQDGKPVEAERPARRLKPVVDLDRPEPLRRGNAKPPHVSRCATGDGGTCNCPGDYCACGNDWPTGHAGPCREENP